MWWVLLIGLVTVYYLYVKKKFNYFSSIGVPHQAGTFPLGSDVTWKMFTGKISIFKISDIIYDEFKEKGAKIAGYFGAFGTPAFVAIDEDLIKKIFIKDFDHFTDKRAFDLHPDTNKYFLRMLISLKGQEWKESRLQMSPIFTTTRMKALMPVIHEVGDSFIKYLNRPDLKKDDLDAKELTQVCVVEILSRIGCGVKPNILDDKVPEENKFYQEIKTLLGQKQGKWGMAKMMFMVLFPKFCYYLKMSFIPPKSMENMAALIRNSIKTRQETGTRMNDFIDFLTDVANNKEPEMKDPEDETEFDQAAKLTGKPNTGHFMKNEDLETDIIAMGILMFFGGSDTTTTTLSLVLHFLANQQDLQEKLYQEIKDAIEENDGDVHLSYTTMTELKFLEAFVKESMRCWGLSFLDRTCTKDYFIPEMNFTIPKGSLVMIPNASLMHSEKNFPNPEKFDPEAHFDKDVLIPSNFYAFGQGPRGCVGMRFAWVIVRSVLVNVVANFKILPGPNLPSKLEIDVKSTNGLPSAGIHVKLEPRE